MTPRTRERLCRGLVLLGLSRGLLWLSPLGPAQFALIQGVFSPLPLVFDTPQYFADYTLVLRHGDERVQLPITQEVVSRVQGPLPRRSMLTHSMALGPRLPEALREQLYRSLFCDPGFLIEELGGRPGADSGAVITRYQGPSGPFEARVELPCGPR